jgi:hypothetical protein
MLLLIAKSLSEDTGEGAGSGQIHGEAYRSGRCASRVRTSACRRLGLRGRVRIGSFDESFTTDNAFAIG